MSDLFYFGRKRMGGLLLVKMLASASHAAQAQQLSPIAPLTGLHGRTIVRVDLLAPLAENMVYAIANKRGGVLPILVSYERLVAARWSIGVEGILNNGFPDAKRHGIELTTRFWAWPDRSGDSPLTGVFVSSQVGYRWIKLTDSDPYTGSYTLRGQRLRTALLGGYQVVRRKKSRFTPVYCVTAGVAHWRLLGTDEVPTNLLLEHKYNWTGWTLDLRGSVGVKF